MGAPSFSVSDLAVPAGASAEAWQELWPCTTGGAAGSRARVGRQLLPQVIIRTCPSLDSGVAAAPGRGSRCVMSPPVPRPPPQAQVRGLPVHGRRLDRYRPPVAGYQPAHGPTDPGPEMQPHARRFPGRPEHIGAARRFVAAALAAWPAAREAAQLLVSEVVTNAIQHSASGDQGGSLEVRYTLDGHEVYVEVLDAGGTAAPKPASRVPGGEQRSRVGAGGSPSECLGRARPPSRPRGLVPPASCACVARDVRSVLGPPLWRNEAMAPGATGERGASPATPALVGKLPRRRGSVAQARATQPAGRTAHRGGRPTANAGRRGRGPRSAAGRYQPAGRVGDLGSQCRSPGIGPRSRSHRGCRPAGRYLTGPIPSVGDEDRCKPTRSRGAVGPVRHPGPPSCLAC